MRYAFAAILFVGGAVFLLFSISGGLLEPLLLGLSGLAASAGMIVRHQGALRYLCAAVLLANAVQAVLGAASANSALWFPIIALSFASAIGIMLRHHWVWIATLVMSITAVGSWTVAVFSLIVEEGWPYSTVGATLISLVPGMLFSTVWVWCAFSAFRLSKPSVTPV